MKKSELQVGVEYACFAHPNTARRRYRFDEPFKARLVAVDFTENRLRESRADHGYTTYLEEKPVFGIAVDTGKKVVIEGREPRRAKDGKYRKYLRGEDGRLLTKPIKAEYDYVILKNAGCFWMTWEEYEQREREDREYKERRAREERERRELAVADEARKERVLNAVVEKITDRYGEPRAYDAYAFTDGDERMTDMTWYGEADDDDVRGRVVDADISYDTYGKSRTLLGADFKIDLFALAELLGIDVQ